MTLDAAVVRRHAHRAYLRGRLSRSWLEVTIACTLILIAALMARQPSVVLIPALALVSLTALFTLAGTIPARAILPGLLLGLLPLACSLSAVHFGHVCGAGGCSSVCVPLCTTGGALAGLLLARAARRTKRPLLVWSTAGSVLLATGALGCACVGATGILGMLAGFLPSAALLALPRRAASR